MEVEGEGEGAMWERERKCGRRGNCGGAESRPYVQGQKQRQDHIWSEGLR